ncbi:asparagine synthase-related protein [Streptococcus mitis]|uniref:asparagine synthase-related protein n=1 Tax=Streptococcus mitis TaxID=28037 RepID=UPI001931E035|nr:asparagine synthase-related protein [Streptococcus mitis]
MDYKFINITGVFDIKSQELFRESISEIFESEEIILELIGEVYYEGVKLDVGEIANLYNKLGIDLLNVVTGIFLIVIFDVDQKELKILHDITTSYFNLYYTFKGNKFFYSTSLKKLLALSKITTTLNNKKISEFVQNGFILDSNTLIKEVDKLSYFSYISIKDRLCIGVPDYKKSNIYTQEEVIENWETLLSSTVKRIYKETGEANITLSSGFDSNYILHTLNKSSNSQISAFCVGGEKGINEIPAVLKIAKFYEINLYIDTVLSDNLEYFPDIVWRLEGSVFECGVILQYYLGKMLSQNKITNIICGESADEVMNSRYHTINHNQYCIDKQNIKYFSYEEYPFYVTNSVVLKKNSLLLHSFGVHPRYPFKTAEVVEMCEKISELNTNKMFHKENCKTQFDSYIIDKVKSIPGTTHLFTCLNMESLSEIINYICEYNNHFSIFSFLEEDNQFFINVRSGLINQIDETMEDNIDRLLRFLYIIIFNEIFVRTRNIEFSKGSSFNKSLSEFINELWRR